MGIKSTLKWYKLAKNGAGVERYVRSSQDQEGVRLMFRLRTGSAGLLVDKKRCRMVSDERCIMCDSGIGEDVVHFLVVCGEFEWDRQVLVDEVQRIVGAGEWIDEFGKVGKEGKVALLLGKGVEGVSNRVLEEVGECVMQWLKKWWKRRKELLYGEDMNGFWSPPPPGIPP